MEDILEELVGDIWDEHDEVIEEFEQLSDVEYKVKTSVATRTFRHLRIDEDRNAQSWKLGNRTTWQNSE